MPAASMIPDLGYAETTSLVRLRFALYGRLESAFCA
jgi:hypothetical protein